jgi:hypothetical protein
MAFPNSRDNCIFALASTHPLVTLTFGRGFRDWQLAQYWPAPFLPWNI